MAYEGMNTDGSGGWSYGLFDCCDDQGSCLKASCCPCCAAGEIWQKGDLSGDNDDSAWWFGCCLFAIGVHHCGYCAYSCVFTEPLRRKRGIQGSCFEDYCQWIWCPCCVHTRNLREVRGT